MKASSIFMTTSIVLVTVSACLAAKISYARQQPPRLDQDPRTLQIKLNPLTLKRTKFLTSSALLQAFKAKKVNILGKKLSGPRVFTPRSVYFSNNLYLEADHISSTSAIENVWKLTHHNGFYLVYNEPNPANRRPFIVTLYGTSTISMPTQTTVTTRTYHGTTLSHIVTSEVSQTIEPNGTIAIPVVVTDLDDINTVRFWTTDGSFHVTAIEYRTLD